MLMELQFLEIHLKFRIMLTFDQNIDVDGLSSLDDLIVDGTVNIQ